MISRSFYDTKGPEITTYNKSSDKAADKWRRTLTKCRGLLAGVAVLAVWIGLPVTARAQEVPPTAVVLHSEENFAGNQQSWALSDGSPYLSVPYLGDALAGRVKSLRLGAEVGVLLFQQPYFASRDNVCGLKLGTSDAPRLWWKGRTALAVPESGNPSNQAVSQPALASGGSASMILFRREVGPPPGALLLERRLVIASGCEETLEANRYNRLFVPIADPPGRLHCLNVSAPASSPGAGKKTPSFKRSGELSVLQPKHFARRLEGVRHRVQVLLFAGPDCSGESVAFPRRNGIRESFTLKDYEFQDTTRSIQVAYLAGEFDRHLTAPGPAISALSAAVVEPDATASTVLPTSDAATTPSLLNRLSASITETETAIVEPIVAAPAIAPAVESQAPPAPTGPSLQPPPPAPLPEAFKAKPPAPAAASTSAQSDTTGGTIAAVPQLPSQVVQPGQSSSQATTLQGAVSSVDDEPAASSGQGGAVVVGDTQVALGQQPQPDPVAQGGTRFDFPAYDLYRLNFCFRVDGECGQPAAQAWCVAQGFSRAASWQKEPHTGALFPTIMMGDNRICDKYLCDGFKEIVCSK